MRYGVNAKCRSNYSDDPLDVWVNTWPTEESARAWMDAAMAQESGYVKVPGVPVLICTREQLLGFEVVPVA